MPPTQSHRNKCNSVQFLFLEGLCVEPVERPQTTALIASAAAAAAVFSVHCVLLQHSAHTFSVCGGGGGS